MTLLLLFSGWKNKLSVEKVVRIFPLLAYTFTLNMEAADVSFIRAEHHILDNPSLSIPLNIMSPLLRYDPIMGLSFIPVLVICIGSLRDPSHRSTYFSTLQIILIIYINMNVNGF
jgi:hypothetical protein